MLECVFDIVICDSILFNFTEKQNKEETCYLQGMHTDNSGCSNLSFQKKKLHRATSSHHGLNVDSLLRRGVI